MPNITTTDSNRQTALQPSASPQAIRAVFIDLDGTLIRTDLLHEAIVALLKDSVGSLLRAILKLGHGRAVFKRLISECVTLEVHQLPFRQDVLDFIAEQRLLGRRVILATASDARWAKHIADELGIFDGVLASEGTYNLKGQAKLEAIR